MLHNLSGTFVAIGQKKLAADPTSLLKMILELALVTKPEW
jgi:hypothetical protein